MNKLMELVDLHADAVCNVLEGAEDATSGKSWVTIRDEYYAAIQAIADSIEKTEQQRDELLEFIKNIRDDMKDGQVNYHTTVSVKALRAAEKLLAKFEGDL